MAETGFTTADAARLLTEVFAPWVAAMGLEATALGPAEAAFVLPASDRLALRGGPGAGVICGQALAALADTASVLALAGANGRFRSCTTVEMSVNYLRPATGDLRIRVAIPRNGRQLATCQVQIREAAQDKPAALATLTFMYLEP